MKEYYKRIPLCLCGLMLFGLGNVFSVASGSAGTNAWNTLALGIAGRSGMGFGTATFCISLVIVLIGLLGKGKFGLGSLLNLTLIPVFSDIFLALFRFIPTAPNAIIGAMYTLLGQIILSFATIIYMTPGLGCGPRDTLMILIGRKFPKLPIGGAKFFIELCALLAGILLQAPFGIGTVLVMVLQASIFQFTCRITHYEPRSIQHEDLPETLRRLFKKNTSNT